MTGHASSKPVPREQIGFLEEYFQGALYLGNRIVSETEQPIGSEHTREICLKEDLEISRSFSKRRILRAGQLVARIVYPLEGREIRP